MYYVYLLKKKNDDDIYYGYTNNLERRLQEHKRNFPKDKYDRVVHNVGSKSQYVIEENVAGPDLWVRDIKLTNILYLCLTDLDY